VVLATILETAAVEAMAEGDTAVEAMVVAVLSTTAAMATRPTLTATR
jgi:hypothetical protein